MFGVLRTPGCGNGLELRREWMGHICGMCTALGREHGQLARLSTNYDTALLVALVDAQTNEPLPRVMHTCPLRPGVRGSIVAAHPAATFAASVSLMAAAVKVRDHAGDREGWAGRVPALAEVAAQHWQKRASVNSYGFALDALDQTAQQHMLEQHRSQDFAVYAAPTEASVGAAFAHTATLANRPENAAALGRIGQLFGRIVYLLDSFRDYQDDLAHGRFNPLAQCCPPDQLRATAQQLFREAHAQLRAAFQQLTLPRPVLLQALLIGQLAHVAAHIFAPHTNQPQQPDGWAERLWRRTTDCCGDCCSLPDCSGCCDCCTCCGKAHGNGCCDGCDCACCDGCDCCGCDC